MKEAACSPGSAGVAPRGTLGVMVGITGVEAGSGDLGMDGKGRVGWIAAQSYWSGWLWRFLLQGLWENAEILDQNVFLFGVLDGCLH